jgi:hypothetical protein
VSNRPAIRQSLLLLGVIGSAFVTMAPGGHVVNSTVELWEDTNGDGVFGSLGDKVLAKSQVNADGSFTLPVQFLTIQCGSQTYLTPRNPVGSAPTAVSTVVQVWQDVACDGTLDSQIASSTTNCGGYFSVTAEGGYTLRGGVVVSPTAAGGEIRGFVTGAPGTPPVAGGCQLLIVPIPSGAGPGMAIILGSGSGRQI